MTVPFSLWILTWAAFAIATAGWVLCARTLHRERARRHGMPINTWPYRPQLYDKDSKP